ncbi:metal-dependent hydrolase [Sulfolobus sp. A20]|uniref:cyclase family protein n=1 Tax=Sulfolobaceae TaxID=118883 RepID=UPI000845C735|nr:MULTISPECIES: cyclase family protein [unclassified Sulfolobus]TRM74173.1 cyclase family protein [Sulfolobus sp. A20-N-F8]TRM75541.1 cyclase family protein [Sulfolobus sp. E5]TRM78477.1 cyclase family protein [Sulfolobus sp. B5]TRM81413.1 cyclase family protein [Sulfolobus sp. D5]TRM85232.1 cyclase family protein [Sulfolobus sp. F3]TRM86991.1 cyclase family protein [Sulfolobus sp. C3]TRM88540.1 cyclase family protein [Sulfolobus sp. E3]TRM99385.1 cyclase family protein [Sulfolobus sp. F1]
MRYNFEEEVKKAPKNWGRWGRDDEIGTLNYITSEYLLDSLKVIRKGKVFTLGLWINRREGDPLWIGRKPTIHLMVRDESSYMVGKSKPRPGGGKSADDIIIMHLQASTQVDALGHYWKDNTLYNGYDSKLTIGGLVKDDVSKLAEKGIVGRGVLLDVARYKGKSSLDKGEMISFQDLLETAKSEGVRLKKRDIILVRTGFLKTFYEKGAEEFYKDFNEPGITYEPELVNWFYENEIIAYGSDTIASEQTYSSTLGIMLPLHIFFLNYLGMPIMEMLWLEELAEDCSRDGQYEFFFVASPLKVIGGTGSPINPVAIK